MPKASNNNKADVVPPPAQSHHTGDTTANGEGTESSSFADSLTTKEHSALHQIAEEVAEEVVLRHKQAEDQLPKAVKPSAIAVSDTHTNAIVTKGSGQSTAPPKNPSPAAPTPAPGDSASFLTRVPSSPSTEPNASISARASNEYGRSPPSSLGHATPPHATMPLTRASLGASFGALPSTPGLPLHRLQANTVAQSIVRSTSAALDPEARISKLDASRENSFTQRPPTFSETPSPDEAHPLSPSGTAASAAATPAGGENGAAVPGVQSLASGGANVLKHNALEVLQRAVNHVRASLHRQHAAVVATAAKDTKKAAAAGAGKGSAAADGTAATATAPAGPQADAEDEKTGARIARAVRAVMRAAEMIDRDDVDSQDEESDPEDDKSTLSVATRHSHKAVDWRDDNVSIVSPSTFFHENDAVEVCSNRVMEYIISRGHAARTDQDLQWLYRHSLLTSLLDDEDLNYLVPRALHREYTSGDVILDAGALVQHLYVVVWGDVDVFRVDSLSSERKALEGAFRVSTHQTAVLRRTSAARTPNRGDSLSTYGSGDEANQGDGGDASGGGGAGSAADVTYTHVGNLYPGQTFGIENCVFNANAQYVFRAGSATSKTVISLLPYTDLQPALGRNPRFAQGVGVCIAGSMDVFGPIREFCRYVFSPTSAQNDYLPLWSILESYTRIHNVIHTKLFSHTVDTGAWGYALNRLPDNVTSTFCFDLVHSLPPFVASRMRVEARAADTRKATDVSASTRTTRTAITYIRTKERRRCTWHLGMEGKTLVLLRDGFTDLLDFLTMLCVHIIESNKLRGRVQGMVHPPAIDILDDYLRKREQEEIDGKYLTAGGITKDAEMQRVQQILKRMPLTEDEQSGLLRNWGHNTLLRVYEIMMHREEYNVRLDPSLSMRFQTNPFHEWALNLRSCVLEKLGLDRFSALPDNLYIDVVSSNTHCIKNLLCSFNRKYRKEILDYVRRKETKRLGQPEEWHNVDDMLYASLTGFLQNERPDLREEYNRSLEENGITVLEDTAMTGLQVDVIPVHLLNFDTIDATIRDSLHEYYEEVVKMDEPDGESGASFSGVPTWAQVCKPIWRRNADGTQTRVMGCMLPHGQGDISTNDDSRAAPHDIDEAFPAQKDKLTSQPSGRAKSAMSFDSTPSTTPTGTHGNNGRLQRHFLINMDFAFGAQAEGICRVIFSAFGKRIRSVSVMGKAGGLKGKRGDIQLASHVLLSKSSLIVEDNQDELRNCRNQDLTAERLQELAGPRVAVHHGKVLTVTGTMLQNVHLLRYYQQVWRCVGAEMEGSYFARVIEDFYRQGIAHPRFISRFAYYTSDLPLAQSDAEREARLRRKSPANAATLSASMTPLEGVPPLYAIARGILENVLL